MHILSNFVKPLFFNFFYYLTFNVSQKKVHSNVYSNVRIYRLVIETQQRIQGNPGNRRHFRTSFSHKMMLNIMYCKSKCSTVRTRKSFTQQFYNCPIIVLPRHFCAVILYDNFLDKNVLSELITDLCSERVFCFLEKVRLQIIKEG